MLTDVHEGKTSIPVTLAPGSNIIAVGDDDSLIYCHQIVGDLSAAGSVSILAGARELANFDLDEGQGLTVDDIVGDDGVPRFKCFPGEDLIVVVTGGDFVGSIVYSRRF